MNETDVKEMCKFANNSFWKTQYICTLSALSAHNCGQIWTQDITEVADFTLLIWFYH